MDDYLQGLLISIWEDYQFFVADLETGRIDEDNVRKWWMLRCARRIEALDSYVPVYWKETSE